MSDDLIKRLSDPNRDWFEFGHDRREAKNLIEQLERENYQLIASLEVCNFAWDQALQQRDEAEAKLAKAVEALQEWDALIQHQYTGSRDAMSNMEYIAQHTADLLAELEGQRMSDDLGELTKAEQRGYANAMEAERKLHEDRIEQLEESNKELTLQLLATSGQAADALDKLFKAMVALQAIADDPYADIKEVRENARTTLAELEGGE